MLLRQVSVGLSLAAVILTAGCCCHKHAAPAPAVVGASPCCPPAPPCANGVPAAPVPAPVPAFSPPPPAVGFGH